MQEKQRQVLFFMGKVICQVIVPSRPQVSRAVRASTRNNLALQPAERPPWHPLVTHKAPLWPGQPCRRLEAWQLPVQTQPGCTRSYLCQEQRCDPAFELSWQSQKRGNQLLYRAGRNWAETSSRRSFRKAPNGMVTMQTCRDEGAILCGREARTRARGCERYPHFFNPQNPKSVWFHLHEEARIGKFMETGNRIEGTRSWRRENGELFHVYRVSV